MWARSGVEYDGTASDELAQGPGARTRCLCAAHVTDSDGRASEGFLRPWGQCGPRWRDRGVVRADLG